MLQEDSSSSSVVGEDVFYPDTFPPPSSMPGSNFSSFKHRPRKTHSSKNPIPFSYRLGEYLYRFALNNLAFPIF